MWRPARWAVLWGDTSLIFTILGRTVWKQDGFVQHGRGAPGIAWIFRPQGMEREVRDKVFVKVRGFRASTSSSTSLVKTSVGVTVAVVG